MNWREVFPKKTVRMSHKEYALFEDFYIEEHDNGEIYLEGIISVDEIRRLGEALKKPRGVWIEFAADGKRVADILHEPKDALVPDSFVWCEESPQDG